MVLNVQPTTQLHNMQESTPTRGISMKNKPPPLQIKNKIRSRLIDLDDNDRVQVRRKLFVENKSPVGKSPLGK